MTRQNPAVGYMVMVYGLESPPAWEAGWHDMFTNKRKARKALVAMSTEHEGLKWALVKVEFLEVRSVAEEAAR